MNRSAWIYLVTTILGFGIGLAGPIDVDSETRRAIREIQMEAFVDPSKEGMVDNDAIKATSRNPGDNRGCLVDVAPVTSGIRQRGMREEHITVIEGNVRIKCE